MKVKSYIYMCTYTHTYYEMIKEKSLKENKNFKSMRGGGIKTKHTKLKTKSLDRLASPGPLFEQQKPFKQAHPGLCILLAWLKMLANRSMLVKALAPQCTVCIC